MYQYISTIKGDRTSWWFDLPSVRPTCSIPPHSPRSITQPSTPARTCKKDLLPRSHHPRMKEKKLKQPTYARPTAQSPPQTHLPRSRGPIAAGATGASFSRSSDHNCFQSVSIPPPPHPGGEAATDGIRRRSWWREDGPSTTTTATRRYGGMYWRPISNSQIWVSARDLPNTPRLDPLQLRSSSVVFATTKIFQYFLRH